MSDFEDEGGDAPCWSHMFEEELMGDGAATPNEGGSEEAEDGPEAGE